MYQKYFEKDFSAEWKDLSSIFVDKMNSNKKLEIRNYLK